MTSRIQGWAETEAHKGTQICRKQLWDINRIRWILRSISELQFVRQKSFFPAQYQNIFKFQIFLYAALKAAVLSKFSTAHVNPVSPLLPWQTVQRQDRVYFFVSSQTVSPFILNRDWKTDKCNLLKEMFVNLFFVLKPLEGCLFSEASSCTFWGKKKKLYMKTFKWQALQKLFKEQFTPVTVMVICSYTMQSLSLLPSFIEN